MLQRLLIYGLTLCAQANAQEHLYDYTIFINSRMSGNYFFSKTKATGSSFISNQLGRLPVSGKVFRTPGNALKLEYVSHKTGNWLAYIYRENIRGQDNFRPVKYFSFSIFIESQTTESQCPSVQFVYKDSTVSEKMSYKISGSKKWETVKIPVANAGEGETPVNIIGVVFSQNSNDGKKHAMYVDDIEFLPETNSPPVTAQPAIFSCKGYAKHVDIMWQPVSVSGVKYIKVYRSRNNKDFLPVGIQTPQINRYSDFTGVTGSNYQYKISFIDDENRESGLSSVAHASTRKMTDDEFLDMVQEACFRYYWEGAESASGLAKENIPGRTDMIASGASGFGMMALLAGAERKFISRQECVERFLKVVNFLERAEKFHGAFSHFIDGPTGKVAPFFGQKDNGGDLVETSFLMQGLLTARAYFSRDNEDEKIIRDKITTIWKDVEWDWYRRFPDSRYLYWHWSPDKEWVINHRLIGWNEVMVTYLLAIASPAHSVPASMYYTGWASQDSIARKYRANWGGTDDGSLYTNGNSYYGIRLDVGVSNGGPLFFTHYSYLGFDPHALTDKYTNYFENNRNIALINYRYCVDNPNHYKGYGSSCWGVTAADGPYGYSASEPVKERDKGKIAPTGAVSSFPYTPVPSMQALKNYYHNYGKFLWGEYGFRDAFNPTENWCSQIYMGLNQGPMVVMIENYRTGLLWKLFMSDPDIQKGLQKLNAETKNQSR